MTYDQYWYGDVWMVEAFFKADRYKQERANNEAWLQGMYIYNALRAALGVSEIFTKKGTTPPQYPEKPYDIGKKGVETQAEREEREEQEEVFALAYMSSMVQNGKHWGKEGG